MGDLVGFQSMQRRTRFSTAMTRKKGLELARPPICCTQAQSVR